MRSVRQALSDPVPPARKVSVPPSPSLDPWKTIIEAWIDTDKVMPKKQRHTARRVFQRLVSEHGAEVSESSVRRYVAVLKANRSISVDKVCVPQTHPLGDEAEVDFGQFHFFLNGVMTGSSIVGWVVSSDLAFIPVSASQIPVGTKMSCHIP